MVQYFIRFLSIILVYNYYQISVKCSGPLHEINLNGMTVYINNIRNIVENTSSLSDNLINTEEKFHIGLTQIRKIDEELNKIMYNYESIDKLNLILNFEVLDDNLEDRYKKFHNNFFDITANDVSEELYKKLIIEYSNKNHEDLKMIREKLSNITDNMIVFFSAKSYDNICEYNYSIAKSHFYIFQLLIILELKAFLIDTLIYLMYAYCHFGINKLKQHDNFMFNNYKNSTEQVQINLNYYQNTLQNYAKKISTNDIYGCTPNEPIIEKETLKLREILQSSVAFESDRFNCLYKDCQYPVFQRNASYKFQLGEYHSTKICYGLLMRCNPVDELKICFGSDSSSKYYAGLKFNNEIYGNFTSCPKRKHSIDSLNNWIIKTCDECICRCSMNTLNENNYKSHGKISFMEETSDIINNLVVTNVKFVEINNTIFMQIEQGPLSKLKNGGNDSNREWKPLNVPWSVLEISQIYKNNKYGQLIKGNGISFGEIHINTSILHLDDIILPFGYVITGVKFAYKTNENENRNIIQIQVRATPYDLITNQLKITHHDEPLSFWTSAESTNLSKILEYKDRRTSVLAVNITDSVPNQTILFRSSGSHDDAEQSIIPYFDSRLTFSKWPFPLSGIGISTKAYNGTNGYITLKTFPYTIPPFN